MPQFTIEDDDGNTLTIEGDSAPDENELEDLFKQFPAKPKMGDVMRDANALSAQLPQEAPEPQAEPPSGMQTTAFLRPFAPEAPQEPDQSAFQELKSFPGEAVGAAGNVVRGLVADTGAGLSLLQRNKGYGRLESIRRNMESAGSASGNLGAAFRGEPLPIDQKIADAASEEGGGPAAFAGHLSQQLAATAPLLAIGGLPGAIQKIAALGFTGDMMYHAKPQFEAYAEEINKPIEEQDPNKIAELQAGIVQTFTFAPALAGHVAKSGMGALERTKIGKEIKYALDSAREQGGQKLPIDIEAFNKANRGETEFPKSTITKEEGGESNASEVTKAAEVHGDVRPPEQVSEQKGVPVKKGSKRVQQKAEGGVLTEAEKEFESGAREHGYGGEVEFVDKPIKGGNLDTGWAIWNKELGRIQVNRKAWNKATPAERAEILKGVTSEEAFHSHTTEQDAAAFYENSTDFQREAAEKNYLRGSGRKLGTTSKTEIGYEMVRMYLQRMNKITLPEMAYANKLDWFGGKLNAKVLDLMDQIVQIARRTAFRKGAKTQQAILRDISAKINAARESISKGETVGTEAAARAPEVGELPLGETVSKAPERSVPLPRTPKPKVTPDMAQGDMGLKTNPRDKRIADLSKQGVLSDADAAELSKLRLERDKEEDQNFPASPRREAEDTADELGLRFKEASAFRTEGMPPEMASELSKIAEDHGWEFTNPQPGPMEGITFYTRKGASRQEILDVAKAKGFEVPEGPASPRRRGQEDVDRILAMPPEEYFKAGQEWSREAMQPGDTKGAPVQIRAEVSALSDPNIDKWQKAVDQAKSDVQIFKDAMKSNMSLMGDKAFMDKYVGAGMKVQFFNEGLSILRGEKQPNERTVKIMSEEGPASPRRRDKNAPDFGDFNDIFDDAVKKIAHAKDYNDAGAKLDQIQKELGEKIKLDPESAESRQLIKIIRGLGDEFWAYWGEGRTGMGTPEPDVTQYTRRRDLPKRQLLTWDRIVENLKKVKEAADKQNQEVMYEMHRELAADEGEPVRSHVPSSSLMDTWKSYFDDLQDLPDQNPELFRKLNPDLQEAIKELNDWVDETARPGYKEWGILEGIQAALEKQEALDRGEQSFPASPRRGSDAPEPSQEFKDELIAWHKDRNAKFREGMSKEAKEDSDLHNQQMMEDHGITNWDDHIDRWSDAVFNIASIPDYEWHVSDATKQKILDYFESAKGTSHDRVRLIEQHLEMQQYFLKQAEKEAFITEMLNSPDADVVEEYRDDIKNDAAYYKNKLAELQVDYKKTKRLYDKLKQEGGEDSFPASPRRGKDDVMSDESGNPIRVYHGTPSKTIEGGVKGPAFFSDRPSTAKTYRGINESRKPGDLYTRLTRSGNLAEGYIKFKNPMEWTEDRTITVEEAKEIFATTDYDAILNPKHHEFVVKNPSQANIDKVSPASPRRGMSKREERLAEQRRRLAEMQAAAKGEEFPEELKSRKRSGVLGGGEEAPVPAEERVVPEGTMERGYNAYEIAQKADIDLAGKISVAKGQAKAFDMEAFADWVRKENPDASRKEILKASQRPIKRHEFLRTADARTKYDRPTFRGFKKWVRNNVENVSSDQLREMWQEAVWGQLLHATPERLEQWRDALGLTAKYGKGKIAPYEGGALEKSIAESKGEIEAEIERQAHHGGSTKEANLSAIMRNAESKLDKDRTRKGQEAAKRYRNKIISAAARKLIGESFDERADLARREVSIDDLDFNNPSAEFGGYIEIPKRDLTTKTTDGRVEYDKVNRILRDQARASKHDPESASRRLVVAIDKNGKVHLLSSYNDAGVQRVVDPSGSRMAGRPHRELNKGFVSQFRPIGSMLLKDPVKGFHKVYDSLGAFNEAIGSDASKHMQVGEFWGDLPEHRERFEEGEQYGEGEEPRGTEVSRGEGGGFMGPGRHRVAEFGSGAFESSAPVTPKEFHAAYDHLQSEVRGHFNSPDDIGLSLIGLKDKHERGILTLKDRNAINAYRKMFEAIEAKNPKLLKTLERVHPDLTAKELRDMADQVIIEMMADKIYENHATAKTYEEFVQKTLGDFAPRNRPTIAPQSERSTTSTFPPGTTTGELPAGRTFRELTPGKSEIPAPVQGPPNIDVETPLDLRRERSREAAVAGYEGERQEGFETQRTTLAERAKNEKKKQIRERYFKTQKALPPKAQPERIIRKHPEILFREVEKINKDIDIAEARKADRGTQPREAANEGFASPRRKTPRRAGHIIMPDTTSPVPRFSGNIKEALTEAMGLEKIPYLGKLWGARGGIKNDRDIQIIGHGIKRSVGRSQSAITGSRLSAINEALGVPFKQDKDGMILNLNAPPDQSRFVSDVFEDWQKQTIVPEKMVASRKFRDADIDEYSEKNPATIKLTPKQDKLFREHLKILEDGYKYLEEKNADLDEYKGETKEYRRQQLSMHGLPKGVEVYPYPRVALQKRGVNPLVAEFRRRIGGKYDLEHERLYKREEEGQKTVMYEPDMARRMTTFLDRVYKAIADTDLSRSPEFKGETAEQRIPRLSQEYKADLMSGRMNQQDVIDMGYRPRLGIEGQVGGHAAFEGKIYPIETANRLNKAFGENAGAISQRMNTMSNASKALVLTGDVAQYLQQGAALMIEHPKIWADATTRSLKAISTKHKNIVGKYLMNPDNWKAAVEFIHSGGSLAHLQDFMSGAEHGQLASKIPGMRQVVERSGRAFGVFQDIAKVEMWKLERENTNRREWHRAVRTIENSVFSGQMESGGMSHKRAIAERILFNAPAYYRAAIDLVAGMAESGRPGEMARAKVFKYAGVVTAGMVSLYLAAGMSWDEIKHRLNPSPNNQKFLKFPVKIKGETVEVGPGGIMLSMLNLASDVADTTLNHPGDLSPAAGMKNPFYKWLVRHFGPMMTLADKLHYGKDIFNRPITLPGTAAQMVTPLAAQKGFQAARSSNPWAGAVSATASFTGLDSSRPRASGEIHELAKKFMKSEGLNKESGWDQVINEEPSYGKLRSAIWAGSQSEFNKVYEELAKTRTTKEIMSTMRKWKDMPFTGSKKSEGAFRYSLNKYEEGIYEQAKEEKASTYDQFAEMLANIP